MLIPAFVALSPDVVPAHVLGHKQQVMAITQGGRVHAPRSVAIRTSTWVGSRIAPEFRGLPVIWRAGSSRFRGCLLYENRNSGWFAAHLNRDYNRFMDTILTTVPAHFDGRQIKIDVPVLLKENTRLLITILDQYDAHQALVQAAMQTSAPTFARVWDNDEDAVYDDL